MEAIVAIIGALSAVISGLVSKLMDDKKRLSFGEFLTASAFTCTTIIFISIIVWEKYVALRASFGLRPFPSISYQLYSLEELSLAPIIFTAWLCATVIFLISLNHWPSSLSADKVRHWRSQRLKGFSRLSWSILALDLAYVVWRWWPVLLEVVECLKASLPR